MLSKGRSPPAVQPHFSKFTDNIGAITWQLDEGNPIGVAQGMVSGDGEAFAFVGDISLSGQVEVWLSDLMAHVCESLRERLLESVERFVEVHREEWLGEVCAQRPRASLACATLGARRRSKEKALAEKLSLAPTRRGKPDDLRQ